MKVRCCAHNWGIVDHTLCLEAAAAGGNPCGYDYGLLRFIFRDQSGRTGIHVTDLTGCLLRAFWHRKDPVAPMPYEQLAVTLGTITHGMIEGDDATVRTEMPLSALGIEGKMDEWYPLRKHITDYKTTRWLVPSRLPYGSHVQQVNMYAAMLRETGEEVLSASIQYIDMSGPTKCRKCKVQVVPTPEGLQCPSCGQFPRDAHLGAIVFDVPLSPHEEVKELIEERRDALLLAVEMNSPPEAEPSFLCAYCHFVDRCPEGRAQVEAQRP